MTSRRYDVRGARSPRCHYDVIIVMTSRTYGARSPSSHYDVILIVTSFAIELATPTIAYERMNVRTDTLPRLLTLIPAKEGRKLPPSTVFVESLIFPNRSRR